MFQLVRHAFEQGLSGSGSDDTTEVGGKVRREDHPIHDVPDGAVGALTTIVHDPDDEEVPFLVTSRCTSATRMAGAGWSTGRL
jgi:hypothetical protein